MQDDRLFERLLDPRIHSIQGLRIARRDFLRRLAGGAVLIGAGGLAGCGGGGGATGGGDNGGDNGGGTPGAPITPAQRAAALAAVNDRLNHLQTEGALDSTSVVAYLKTRPEFAAVGSVKPGGAWARFTDGQLYIVSFNLPPELDGRAADYDPQAISRAANSELPTFDRVRIFNALGTAFSPPHADIRSWFVKHGYTPINAAPEATVEALKTVSGDGVFYINTHGDYGKLGDGTETWSMWTATEVSEALDAQYSALLASGALVRFSAIHDKAFFQWDPDHPRGNFATHYAITPKFLQQFDWKFGPNAFVFMNCCWSGDVEFQNACLSRGASVYAGWTNAVVPAGAWRAGRFIFDRLLGQLKDGNHEYSEPDGLQRPFDALAVKADLNARGWNVTNSPTYGEAQLLFFHTNGGGDFGLLAPSIQQVDVDERSARLILKGLFGSDDPATAKFVTVSGRELKILKWEKERIECELPTDVAGDVQVRVGVRKSNVRQLTEWNMTIRYKWFDSNRPGLQVTGPVKLRFRADIGEYRLKPGQTPTVTERTAVATKESGTTQVASGSYNDGQCTATWKGTMTFPAGGYDDNAKTALLAWFKVDPKTKKGAIGLAYGATAEAVLFTETDVCPDSAPVTNKFAIAFGLMNGPSDFADPLGTPGQPAIPLPALNLTFDNNFGLAAGSFHDPALEMSMDWDAAPAKFPPDPQAARSARL